MTVTADKGALAFAEKLLGLLGDGRFAATYKYAVILGLTDLCLERSGRSGSAPPSVTTAQLAEKVIELYWPHTMPFSTEQVLRQNLGGQADILTQIAKFRARRHVDPTASLTRSRLADQDGFKKLARAVEWRLVKMPLPKLQRIGREMHTFVYQINWDDDIKVGHFNGPGFDNSIRFMPGAGDHLVRLSGLIRPLVQREWAALVARFNKLPHAGLEDFLFGPRRIALGAVRSDLRELQGNECFYCASRIRSSSEVDHFIPWTRYPNDGLANLVLADRKCNNAKRDHLASTEHVAKWVERAAHHMSDLEEIAKRRNWQHHPDRSLSVGRSIYLRLPDDSRLWQDEKLFVEIDRNRLLKAFRLHAA